MRKRRPIRSGVTKTVIAGLLSTSLPAPTGNLCPAGSRRRPIRSGVTKTVIAGPDRQSLPCGGADPVESRERRVGSMLQRAAGKILRLL